MSENVRQRPMKPEKETKTREAQNTGTASGMLSRMDQKWRTFWIRGVFTFIMVGLFSFFLYMGPLAMTVVVVVVFLKCYEEIITIGYSKYQEYNLPLYRVLNWLFVSVAMIFIVGSNLIQYYTEFFMQEGLPSFIATYHRLGCFSLYILGFVIFVLTLKKDSYVVQFTMFGWTHVTIFLLGMQIFLILQNIYESLFWFLLPVSMVICNDIMAYIFGIFFGKTPLIKLSPKKTWEGFIGGFASTLVWGLLFSYLLTKYNLACYSTQEDCLNSPLFVLKEYRIPLVGGTITMYPVMIHSLTLATFASLIAPFGGFFASGFKRAFKVKDFADVIPGHGGLMDRFDCQMVMASFSNVYYFTFCRAPNIDRVLAMILALTHEQQLQVLTTLQDKLKATTL